MGGEKVPVKAHLTVDYNEFRLHKIQDTPGDYPAQPLKNRGFGLKLYTKCHRCP